MRRDVRGLAVCVGMGRRRRPPSHRNESLAALVQQHVGSQRNARHDVTTTENSSRGDTETRSRRAKHVETPQSDPTLVDIGHRILQHVALRSSIGAVSNAQQQPRMLLRGERQHRSTLTSRLAQPARHGAVAEVVASLDIVEHLPAIALPPLVSSSGAGLGYYPEPTSKTGTSTATTKDTLFFGFASESDRSIDEFLGLSHKRKEKTPPTSNHVRIQPRFTLSTMYPDGILDFHTVVRETCSNPSESACPIPEFPLRDVYHFLQRNIDPRHGVQKVLVMDNNASIESQNNDYNDEDTIPFETRSWDNSNVKLQNFSLTFAQLMLPRDVAIKAQQGFIPSFDEGTSKEDARGVSKRIRYIKYLGICASSDPDMDDAEYASALSKVWPIFTKRDDINELSVTPSTNDENIIKACKMEALEFLRCGELFAVRDFGRDADNNTARQGSSSIATSNVATGLRRSAPEFHREGELQVKDSTSQDDFVDNNTCIRLIGDWVPAPALCLALGIPQVQGPTGTL